MPNLDLDEGVDLAVLWQNLQQSSHFVEDFDRDRPWPPCVCFSLQSLSWMQSHGIHDVEGLNEYRDKGIYENNVAKGFTLVNGKWRTKAEIKELERKKMAEIAKLKASPVAGLPLFATI